MVRLKFVEKQCSALFIIDMGLTMLAFVYECIWPRQDYQGAYIAVIMKMLDAIDRGESPTILGDGSEAFDFVVVEDCAHANVRNEII